MSKPDPEALWNELNTLRGQLASLTLHFDSEVEGVRQRIVTLREQIDSFFPAFEPVEFRPELESPRQVAAMTAEEAPVKISHPADLSAAPSYSPPSATRPVAPVRPPAPVRPVVPPPAIDPQPPTAAEQSSFELQLGRVWLGRIGIAVLITGLVLLGNFAYQNFIQYLHPAVKLLFLYLAAGSLAGAGLWVKKRENTALFGEVVLAGGLAFGYWCTFAAHHVPKLRVIDSPVLGALLVFAAAGGITALSLAWRSRIIGIMGLLLASYATVLQPVGWLSAVSNLTLSIGGMFLMVRGRWAGPGWISLVGSYLSFFWWQLGPGMQSTDPATLWFLPPTWIIFTASMVIHPELQTGLSLRAKNWFITFNNAAFYLLFVWVWERFNGHSQIWLVTGVYGAALFFIGAWFRNRQAFGGFFLAQGLAVATLAMTLKLEGDDLAVGLSLEAALLAVAFWRYRARTELIFVLVSVAAGLFQAYFLEMTHRPLISGWSALSVGVALLLSGWFVKAGSLQTEKSGVRTLARIVSAGTMILGALVLLVRFCLQLDASWHCPSIAGVVLALTLAWNFVKPVRIVPEIATLTASFGLAALMQVFTPQMGVTSASIACGSMGFFIAHVIWARFSPLRGDADVNDFTDLSEAAPVVTTGILAMVTAVGAILSMHDSPDMKVLYLGSLSLGAAAIGRFLLKSPVLSLVSLGGIPVMMALNNLYALDTFAYCLPLGVSGALLAGSMLEEREVVRHVIGGICRTLLGIAWFLLIQHLLPQSWGEVMALTAMALGTVAIVKNRGGWFPEVISFAAIALSRFGWQMSQRSWELTEGAPDLSGWALTLTLLTFLFLLRGNDAETRSKREILSRFAFVVLGCWATHVEVLSFGWKPVVVLWAFLGFASVSTGLWQKITGLRHMGFALLALAMGKLFVFDIWDFAAFVRVAAFLALGVVLVLLGFFYNRFADVIKKLFESEKSEG